MKHRPKRQPKPKQNRPRSEFKILRQRAGLTLQQAIALLELEPPTARRYERGDTRPQPFILSHLCKEGDKRVAGAKGRGDFDFIDLFAGIGGLRMAFESIGGRCVFTSEWDPACQETYALNFPHDHPIEGDIREFSRDPRRIGEIPRHDVLLAGFPCQPFSIAGVSKKNALGVPHGFDCDIQGTLFFDTVEIIKARKPAIFVLENVKNLPRHDKGRTFARIMHELENVLGYDVHYRIISAEPWVPQKRERIFIVGFRDAADFDFGKLSVPSKDLWPKLGKILEKPGKVDPKYTLTPNLWKYLQDYKRKHNEQGNGFGFSRFTPDQVTRTLSARYYKDGSEILIDRPGSRPRRLTPAECARLMGFDMDGRQFRIVVSDTQAYRQFGNAVVPPVARAVAKLLKGHIRAAVAKRRAKEAEKAKPTHRHERRPDPAAAMNA